ncbi:MAG TPA: prolyl oligopeptidase family serine peptidase [Vicinamibacterales bacterium]|nr:prolyl oligopeptidase family serine peptidase [Vicinamibacterales bacterium]
MRTRTFSIRIVAALAAFGGVAVGASRLPIAQSGDIKDDYARAFAFRARIDGTVHNIPDPPTWLGDGRFWYRRTVRGGAEFVVVDAATARKQPLFDHARLAAALSSAAHAPYTATTLPFTTLTVIENANAIQFGTPRWRCTLTDYACTRVSDAGDAAGGSERRGAQGRGGPGATATTDSVRRSPDGLTDAGIEQFNVVIRPAGAPASSAVRLTEDGVEGNAYTAASLAWSPDSKKIAVYRRVPGYQRTLTLVQSSPTDQLQPKVITRNYRKPGDEVDHDQPVVIDLASRRTSTVDITLFPTAYDISRPVWRTDGRAFTFEYNQRGHETFRVIEVNAATANARVLIDEHPGAFFDYRPAVPGLTGSGRRFRADVNDGKEIIWMSERDGWSHLYLYDGETGAVKNQITKGAWAVHNVDRVDEANRQIWFTANGMNAGQDPYFFHSYRINFDGSGLVAYTSANAQHSVSWSPNRTYYVDTYSRVDTPPVSELHRANDRSLVATLERADAADLLATGWRAPEVFTAKGRDAATDIWGIIIRPTNFDPARKYPVIETIYAGPHGSFVPKTFNSETGAAWLVSTMDMQALSELGFIVVQIDGMGTANRSKAFHNVAWKNLADGGFDDRIRWHKAVAAKYPYYDITRVGIYGTSAGGQESLAALLFHADFYKAAASSAGCHDNRMDKIWWNEQWMSYPIGPQYAASSNTEHASSLKGDLMLLVGELDTNVDPASTMQVVNQLVKANKDFELVVIPGADHTNGGAYGDHKRFDFFVRHLQHREPPAWNQLTAPSSAAAGLLDVRAEVWAAAEE